MDTMDMKTKNTSVETDDPLLASQELQRNVKSRNEVGNEQQTDLEGDETAAATLTSLRKELRKNIEEKTLQRVAAVSVSEGEGGPAATKPAEPQPLERPSPSDLTLGHALEPAGPRPVVTESFLDAVDDFDDFFYEDDSDDDNNAIPSTVIERHREATLALDPAPATTTEGRVSPPTKHIESPPPKPRARRARKVPKEWERSAVSTLRDSKCFVVDDTVKGLYAAQEAYAGRQPRSPYKGSWMEREQQKLQVELEYELGGLKRAVGLAMRRAGVVKRDRGPRLPAHDPKGWIRRVGNEVQAELRSGRRKQRGAARPLKVWDNSPSYNVSGPARCRSDSDFHGGGGCGAGPAAGKGDVSEGVGRRKGPMMLSRDSNVKVKTPSMVFSTPGPASPDADARHFARGSGGGPKANSRVKTPSSFSFRSNWKRYAVNNSHRSHLVAGDATMDPPFIGNYAYRPKTVNSTVRDARVSAFPKAARGKNLEVDYDWPGPGDYKITEPPGRNEVGGHRVVESGCPRSPAPPIGVRIATQVASHGGCAGTGGTPGLWRPYSVGADTTSRFGPCNALPHRSLAPFSSVGAQALSTKQNAASHTLSHKRSQC